MKPTFRRNVEVSFLPPDFDVQQSIRPYFEHTTHKPLKKTKKASPYPKLARQYYHLVLHGTEPIAFRRVWLVCQFPVNGDMADQFFPATKVIDEPNRVASFEAAGRSLNTFALCPSAGMSANRDLTLARINDPNYPIGMADQQREGWRNMLERNVRSNLALSDYDPLIKTSQPRKDIILEKCDSTFNPPSNHEQPVQQSLDYHAHGGSERGRGRAGGSGRG